MTRRIWRDVLRERVPSLAVADEAVPADGGGDVEADGARSADRQRVWGAAQELRAPTLSDFEQLAKEAFGRLPSEVRALCSDVIIRISDFPSREVIEEQHLNSGFDLLGLFHGVGLASQEEGKARRRNTIDLYRRPILDYWIQHTEGLGAIVMHVLLHNIANHIGLTNEDIEAIEWG